MSERGRAQTVRARDECETDLPGDGSEVGSVWVCTNAAAAAAAAAAEEGLLPFYGNPAQLGTFTILYAKMSSRLPYPHPMTRVGSPMLVDSKPYGRSCAQRAPRQNLTMLKADPKIRIYLLQLLKASDFGDSI